MLESSSICAFPSITILTSKDVPPISIQINPFFDRSFTSLNTVTPAIVPPTGPESKVWTGFFFATSALTTPPLDCIIRIGTFIPSFFNEFCRLVKYFIIIGEI